MVLKPHSADRVVVVIGYRTVENVTLLVERSRTVKIIKRTYTADPKNNMNENEFICDVAISFISPLKDSVPNVYLNKTLLVRPCAIQLHFYKWQHHFVSTNSGRVFYF